MADRIALFVAGCLLAWIALRSLTAIWTEPRPPTRKFGFGELMESFWKACLVLGAGAGAIATFAVSFTGG